MQDLRLKDYLSKDNLKKYGWMVEDKEGQSPNLYSSKRNWYWEAFYNQKLSLEGQKVWIILDLKDRKNLLVIFTKIKE
jgi:hypothetical protein